MASLQTALSNAVAQLRDLTLSQRIAIVLGGVLVTVSLVWLLQWAAAPEMVPLLDQSLAPEDIALIQSGLDALGETYERNGAIVLVRASADRPAILAKLQAQEQLPGDTSISFAALVKESNPWISSKENDRRWSVALANELERVLRQLSGVKTAKVFLNLSTGRKGFSREQPRSTGSVTLIMRGGEPVSESLGKAAARLVAGAVSGLAPHRVEVIDGGNGRSVVDWDVEAGGATQLQRLKREHERRLAAKVKGQLADSKARVSVQVEIENATRSQQSTTFSDPVEIEREKTSDDTTRRRPMGQPGVQPNVGVTSSGAGIDEKTEKETESTKSQASNKNYRSWLGNFRRRKTSAATGVAEITLPERVIRSVYTTSIAGSRSKGRLVGCTQVFTEERVVGGIDDSVAVVVARQSRHHLQSYVKVGVLDRPQQSIL